MNAYETQYTMFTAATVMVYVLTALSLFGVSRSAPTYLMYLRTAIQLYVGMFLVIRFRPFGKDPHSFSELDRKVAFSAGALILMTTALATYLQRKIVPTVSASARQPADGDAFIMPR